MDLLHNAIAGLLATALIITVAFALYKIWGDRRFPFFAKSLVVLVLLSALPIAIFGFSRGANPTKRE